MTVWTTFDASTILAIVNLLVLLWVARRGRSNLRSVHYQLRKLREETQRTAGRLRRTREGLERLSARNTRQLKMLSAMSESAKKRHEVLRDGQLELALLEGLAGLHFPYPFFLTGWTIHGFLAHRLVELLEERQPTVVVELGSGSSTVLIAAMIDRLAMAKATHISVDHMSQYLRRTEQALERQRLAARPRLLLCPLEPSSVDGIPWYSGLPAQLAGLKIDLLLVDGPPGGDHPLSRLPALDLLRPLLAPGATVLLDDVKRPAEAQIVERWSQSHPDLQVRINTHGKGYAEFTLPSDAT